MRVLIVHNRYRSGQPSGENTVVEDEAMLLAEHGDEVLRMTVSSDEIAQWPALSRATLGARVVWSAEGYRSVAEAIARARPDVVHLHNTFPLLSPAALWAARRSGVAVVQTLHNFRPFCAAGKLFRHGHVCEDCVGHAPLPALRHGCYRSSRTATLPLVAMNGLHATIGTWRRCVDRFITPSEFVRGRYVAAGWAPEQLAVKFNTAASHGAPRAGAGRGFAYLGRLEQEKGIDVLLDAWELAFPDGEERLTVVGDGHRAERYRERAARLPNVRFLGHVTPERVRSVMREARAVVVPSVWYEVFGRTVVEAYALGVPVVASAIGGLTEIVSHEQTGLLVAPGAAQELAGALRRLAGDELAAARLGANARAAYEGRLSPGVTTRRLRSIYADARRLAAARLPGVAAQPATEVG